MKLSKIIFVLGKGGTGKTTYSAGLNAVKIISLDEIVRPWDDPADLDDDYVFNVYKSGGNCRIIALKQRLANEVLAQMTTVGLFVIEGAVECPQLLRLIACGTRFEVHYLRPASVEMLKKSMIQRVVQEYALSKRRLGRVWIPLSRSENNAAMVDFVINGSDGLLFQKFMEGLAVIKYAEIDSGLVTLTGIDVKIVNISW